MECTQLSTALNNWRRRRSRLVEGYICIHKQMASLQRIYFLHAHLSPQILRVPGIPRLSIPRLSPLRSQLSQAPRPQAHEEARAPTLNISPKSIILIRPSPVVPS